MSRSRIEVYGKLTGRSFDLRPDPNGPELQSATIGFTVIRGYSVDWISLAASLDKVVQASTARLVVFRPWSPGMHRKLDQLTREWAFDPMLAFGPVRVGVTDRCDASVSQLVRMVSNFTDASSGVGLVAASSLSAALLGQRVASLNLHGDPMMFVLVGLIDLIDLGLAFDEGAESTLLLRGNAVDQTVFDEFLKTATQRAEMIE